jgi:hypothetical protein
VMSVHVEDHDQFEAPHVVPPCRLPFAPDADVTIGILETKQPN